MKQYKNTVDPLFLTPEKTASIEKELEDIDKVELPIIQKRMAVAYEDGDLPENNPWIAANNDLQETLKKRNDLRRLLDRGKQYAKLQSTVRKTQNRVGKTFVVSINGQKEITAMLVASEEADPLTHKISCDSPIGKAMLDAKIGQEVQVETPGGMIQLLIKHKV